MWLPLSQWVANCTSNGHPFPNGIPNVTGVASLAIPPWATTTPTGPSWSPPQTSSTAVSTSNIGTVSVSTTTSTSRGAATSTIATTTTSTSRTRTVPNQIGIPPASTSTSTSGTLRGPLGSSEPRVPIVIAIILIILLFLLLLGLLYSVTSGFWARAKDFLSRRLRRLPPPPPAAWRKPLLVGGIAARCDLEGQGNGKQTYGRRVLPIPYDPATSIEERDATAAPGLVTEHRNHHSSSSSFSVEGSGNAPRPSQPTWYRPLLLPGSRRQIHEDPGSTLPWVHMPRKPPIATLNGSRERRRKHGSYSSQSTLLNPPLPQYGSAIIPMSRFNRSRLTTRQNTTVQRGFSRRYTPMSQIQIGAGKLSDSSSSQGHILNATHLASISELTFPRGDSVERSRREITDAPCSTPPSLSLGSDNPFAQNPYPPLRTSRGNNTVTTASSAPSFLSSTNTSSVDDLQLQSPVWTMMDRVETGDSDETPIPSSSRPSSSCLSTSQSSSRMRYEPQPLPGTSHSSSSGDDFMHVDENGASLPRPPRLRTSVTGRVRPVDHNLSPSSPSLSSSSTSSPFFLVPGDTRSLPLFPREAPIEDGEQVDAEDIVRPRLIRDTAAIADVLSTSEAIPGQTMVNTIPFPALPSSS
ncbi:hypothetical protein FRC19_011544 [Serendipita sp. 401]|nr:hypothetical protein FRC15_001371 [Serendipita sp. 397]KAG8827843.1 hypothetical protein FRC19_011544 [Serendipita sp. 401]KAG9058193.1 hypothetical protein FS842_000134 [Serendipita sp. 407]